MTIGFQIAASVYMIGMALVISTENLRSALLFKVFPMGIALPLGFLAFATFMGWPVQ